MRKVEVVFWLSTVFLISALAIEWRSPSYNGDPIGSDNVGGVIFDPGIGSNRSAECFKTAGQVTIKLSSCPLNGLSYVSTNDNKVVLSKSYPLSRGASATIPDCIVTCTDSSKKTVTTALTIIIYEAPSSNQPPVWALTFPTNVTLWNLQPYAFLMRTPAIDPDTDKLNNGRLTYFVDEIDASKVVYGVNDFLEYKDNGDSPDLMIAYTLPWEIDSIHSVKVAAKDNPKNATANIIYKTIALVVARTATIGSKIVFPTTSSVYVTPTNAALPQTSTASTCPRWGTNLYSIYCDNNWIWTALGGAGVIGLVIVIIVAAVCFGKYGKPNTVHDVENKPNQLPPGNNNSDQSGAFNNNQQNNNYSTQRQAPSQPPSRNNYNNQQPNSGRPNDPYYVGNNRR